MNLEVLEERTVPATFNWTQTAAAASWNDVNSWDSGADGAFPNANVDIANLNTAQTGPQTISLGQAITVNQLNIDNSAGAGNSYTIGGGGTNVLTLAGTSPQITSTSTNSNTISSPISLGATTTLSKTGTGTLSLSGAINGIGGITVPATSTGVISITGANSFTGADTISGKLSLQGSSPLGTGNLTLSGATLSFQLAPGLAPTKFTATGSLNGLDPTANPVQNQPTQLGTTELNDNTVNDVTLDPTTLFWNHNTQFNYEGYFFVGGTSNVVYEFAENIDDDAWLKIDTTVILSDTQWNIPTEGAITLAPGWHKIDARGQNGGGGAGPSSQNPNGWSGWVANLGMLINKTDTTSLNVAPGGDWSTITDPGDGSFLQDNNLPNAAVTLIGSNSIDVGAVNASTPGIAAIAGAMSGTGGITKTGAGELILTGTNTYSGGTTINGGYLVPLTATSLSPSTSYTIGAPAFWRSTASMKRSQGSAEPAPSPTEGSPTRPSRWAAREPRPSAGPSRTAAPALFPLSIPDPAACS
jgi:autotransporter-associated beta strand protein